MESQSQAFDAECREPSPRNLQALPLINYY